MVPQETPEYRKKSRLLRHHHDRRLDSPPGPHAQNVWLHSNAEFVFRRGNWTLGWRRHLTFIFSLDVQAGRTTVPYLALVEGGRKTYRVSWAEVDAHGYFSSASRVRNIRHLNYWDR